MALPWVNETGITVAASTVVVAAVSFNHNTESAIHAVGASVVCTRAMPWLTCLNVILLQSNGAYS